MRRSPNQSILCFDKNKDSCDLVTFLFEQEGFEVISCETASDFSNQIRERKFNALILENHFGEATQHKFCEEVRRIDKNLPIIFYSCEVRKTEIEKALAAGADAYLIKPSDFDILPGTVIKFSEERG